MRPALLLFAYYYPPLGGPAVQRPCKTVKYLTRLGWDVDVITVKDTLYHSTDTALAQECSHRHRWATASFDPLYLLNKLTSLLPHKADGIYSQTGAGTKARIKKLFPIDDKAGWLPFACKAGMQAVLTHKYKAVMVSCNPFSTAFAALIIARKARLPLIVDYRDHWTLNNMNPPAGRMGRAVYPLLERYLLRTASLILTATATMKHDLTTNFGSELEGKTMPFFNGWDEEDFTGVSAPPREDGKLRLTYLGTLYQGRSIANVLQAVKAINAEQPSRLEVRLIGNFPPESLAEVQNSGIADAVVIIPQLNHREAILQMLSSDILLLIVGDKKLKWVLTGKLFEYLRSMKPILALATKDSEAAEILLGTGHDSICDIHDPADIQNTLQGIIRQIETHSFSFVLPTQYERSNQAGNLHNRLTALQVLKARM